MLSQCTGTRTAPASTAVRSFLPGRSLRAAAPQGSSSRRLVALRAVDEQVSSAYATALVELAEAEKSLDAVHADVDGLSSVLKDNGEMSDFLMNPVVGDDKKKDVLDKLACEADFTESTTKFLKLVVDKGRIECIQEICDAFEAKYCELTDTQVASVRSAVHLEKEQQFMIAKKLQELTGSKNIKLKPVVDEDLLAGFVVEYGSSQIDLSVKGQVSKIQTDMEMSED